MEGDDVEEPAEHQKRFDQFSVSFRTWFDRLGDEYMRAWVAARAAKAAAKAMALAQLALGVEGAAPVMLAAAEGTLVMVAPGVPPPNDANDQRFVQIMDTSHMLEEADVFTLHGRTTLTKACAAKKDHIRTIFMRLDVEKKDFEYMHLVDVFKDCAHAEGFTAIILMPKDFALEKVAKFEKILATFGRVKTLFVSDAGPEAILNEAILKESPVDGGKVDQISCVRLGLVFSYTKVGLQFPALIGPTSHNLLMVPSLSKQLQYTMKAATSGSSSEEEESVSDPNQLSPHLMTIIWYV